MATKDVDLAKLKELLYSARVIIEERNLYHLWDHVPKNDDPDFGSNSFNQMVVQRWRPQTYQAWTDELESAFAANNLDLLRFKMATLSGDARKVSKEPAALFVRRVNELDRIVSDQAVLNAYKTETKQAASWPPITYKDGVVSQGDRHHTFRDPIYIKMLDLLWDKRRIESQSKEVLSNEKALGRDTVNKKVGLKDHERFTDIATGIRKAMKSKQISLRLMYPDKVFLVARQNRA